MIQTSEDNAQISSKADDHRRLTIERLSEIVERTRSALVEAGIGRDLYFAVPGSGHAVLTFCTVAAPDPTEEEWEGISKIVREVMADVLGGSFIGRELPCAAVRASGEVEGSPAATSRRT